MHIKRRKGKYVLDYYVKPDGVLRRREETYPTKKLAELAMAKRKVEIAEGKFLDISRKPVLGFDEAVEKYMEWAKGNKISWQRDEQSLAHWLAEIGSKKLAEICRLDMERYKLKRKEKVAPRTVNEELACLRRLFYRMIEWGFTDSNPVKGIKLLREPPGRIRILSPEEEARLLAACNPSLRLLVLTALHTGCRRGELLALTWDDIDFGRGVMIVRNSKNGERREIPMSDTLQAALKRVPRTADRVFVSRNGKPFTVHNTFERAVRKAGLSDLRFHDLRHCFASNLVMRGVDLVTVARLLGHKSLRMTSRYAHVSMEHVKKSVRVLDGEFLETRTDKAIAEGS